MTGKELVEAGKKLLGVPYEQLDCQGFVEQAMSICGTHRNWRGSNHMYRDVRGVTPINWAKDIYGSIPAGAAVFIWANDGGEIQRGYNDGLGNASHVGITTGELGDHGVLNSSKSKGGVCYSRFQGKEINGGWNYIGFFREVDYGEHIEKILREDAAEGDIMVEGKVVAENGKPVNVRSKPDTSSRALTQLPVGSTVQVIAEAGTEWYQIDYKGQPAYMMRKFIELQPEEDEPDDELPVSVEDRLSSVEKRLDRLEHEWTEKMGWS